MLENLTELENNIIQMLIQGHNAKGISDILGIDYIAYIKIKKSILKKLHITKTIQLLLILIMQGEQI